MNVCIIVPFTAKTNESLKAVAKFVVKMRRKNKDLYILGIDNNSKVSNSPLDTYFDGILCTDYEKTPEDAVGQGIEFAIEEGFDFVGWNDDIIIEDLSTSYITLKNGNAYYGVYLS